MYNNILFIVFLFFFSLIYINKFKQEDFVQSTNTSSQPPLATMTPTTTKLSEQENSKSSVYFYNFDDSIGNIEENNDDKLMKYYDFSKNNPKIIIKLNNNTSIENFYISFYVKFNKDTEDKDKQTFIKHITTDNKTNWSMFKYKNNIYGSVNKEFHKFYTPIDDNDGKNTDTNYYFVMINQKYTDSHYTLNLKINDELIEPIQIDTNIENNSFLVFGGSKNNKLDDTDSYFKGRISNIKYGYIAPSSEEYQKKQCKFYPQGESKSNCETQCAEYDSITCNPKICTNICSSCKDKITCPWNNKEKQPQKPIPNAPDPIRTTAGNKRIIIEWKKPFEGTNGKIVSYIVTVKEAYPTDKSKNDEMIYNFDANDCENCQYEIKDLKNTIYYDISVKSQNRITYNEVVKNNISKTCSNVEIVAPIGPINMKDYHPSLIESDEEIQMIYNNNLSEGNITCDKDKYKLSENTLDTLDIDKYSSNAITKQILGEGEGEAILVNNNNNTKYNHNKISDDILQYLGNNE